MKGDMYLAWSPDEEILKRAECGGAVTSLLKFALESGRVDAVLAVKARDGNRYEGVPALIADPDEVTHTAGALHCVSPNIARCLKEYLGGAFDVRVAVTCRPCDARAIIELAKRNQIEMDNLILVGLNCTGTLRPVTAKQMLREEFGVDPDDVIGEDIEDGKLTISLKDGAEIVRDLAQLEEKGYGRRENCQRCEIGIPRMADIACGKWGTNGRKVTFIEVCSQKGSDFIEKAIEVGAIRVERPDSKAVETREEKDEEAIHSARRWQEQDFAHLRGMSIEERFTYWTGQFSQCIKCFGCRDACPICYCLDCYLEADRGTVTGGQVPPDIMFPIIRIMHVADSCVNCGQCQDVCPSEIPLSRLVHMLNRELDAVFKYEPGMDVSAPPPLAAVMEEELAMSGVDISPG